MPRLFVLVLALVLVLAAAAPAARAAGAPEPLRWRLSPDQGLEYKVAGPDPRPFCDGAPDTRTLYGAELAPDGDRLALPVGRPIDLAFHYLFRLPRGPADAGAVLPVDDLHPEPPFTVGPIGARGESRVTRRQGSAFVIETRLELRRGEKAPKEARFQGGTLSVTQVFDQKRGILVTGEVEIAWTEREGDPPKEKKLAHKASVLGPRPVDLAGGGLRARAELAVKRAYERDLRPFLAEHAYRPKGSEHALGHLALGLYAAVKAGIDPAQAPLAAGFEELDRLPARNTYSIALAILALESRSVRRAKPRAGETQIRFEKDAVDRRDLERMERLSRALLEARDPRGLFYYLAKTEPRPKDRDTGDLSTTQFAALALHAAARSGVKLDAGVWRSLAEAALGNQDENGPEAPLELRLEAGAPVPAWYGEGTGPRSRRARGFCYYPPGFWRYCYGSMSAAGVSTLDVARAGLIREKVDDPELLGRVERGIADGLAWLGAHFVMRENWPDNPFQPFYAVYSLEKAYELPRIERIQGHDWWSEGAEELLLREKQGGGFGAEPSDSAFAILFLTRASTEPDYAVREAGPEATGGGAAGEPDAALVEGVGLVSAREVIRATEVREPEKRKGRIELAEKAIAALDEERRPLVVPALGKLLASSYPECRKLAERALREIAGEKLEGAEKAEQFFEAWSAITASGRSGRSEEIAGLRARLKEARAPGLKRAAALALTRLRALEAVPDLVAELERTPEPDKGYRGYVRRILVGTLGRDAGDDPAAWRSLWKTDGEGLLAREELRRDIRRLGRPECWGEARERIRKAGPLAVRALIDALGEGEEKAVRTEAEALLRDMTGKDFGQDRAAWETWWREEGQRK